MRHQNVIKRIKLGKLIISQIIRFLVTMDGLLMVTNKSYSSKFMHVHVKFRIW